MEVERVGCQHSGCGCRANAEDGQHQNGRCDADDPKRSTPPTGVAQEHIARRWLTRLRTQPPFQAPLRLEVLDPICDAPGLGRSKPGAFVPFEQALK